MADSAAHGAYSRGDPHDVSLTAGERLGPYRILALLGAGGMGEVYRARDERLARDVALKLLPPALASKADQVGRFEREARALAALNHPNIATLYDIERESGRLFFTMELVEGQTLADRILRGPLPVEEAIALFEQLALALEAAHGRGLVHRDLKPSNLMVTRAGVLKVLDFGLAKAFADDSGAALDTRSPTLSDDPAPGARAGTPAYMSPEQTRGEPADRRTDLWAFGCCLYEALSGTAAFAGRTTAEVAAAVLTRTPSFDLLPPDTPPPLRVLLRRCLQRDPARRLRDAGDARLEIEEARSNPPVAEGEESRGGGRPRSARATPARWLVSVGAVVVAAIAVLLWRSNEPSAPARPPVRFTLQLPPGFHLRGTAPALSPDGRRIAMIVMDDRERTSVWVRALDEVDGRPLAGTEGAGGALFWRRDGEALGFATDSRVRAVALSGGDVQNLAEFTDTIGAAWGKDVVLVGRKDTALHRVSVGGAGSPSAATVLDASRRERAHLWPHFLPDGRRFVYVALSQGSANVLYVGELGSDLKKKILEDVSQAVYVEPGLLLFARRTALLAQRFDAEGLELLGEPFRVADPVLHFPEWGVAPFTVSANGVLAYANPQNVALSRLVWHDRNGRILGTIGEDGSYMGPSLSLDDRRLVIERFDSGSNGDLWMYDLERGSSVRLTSSPGRDSDAVWSPDGKTIVFARAEGGPGALYRMSVGGGPPELLLSGTTAYPSDWTPDGRAILYAAYRTSTRGDIEWITSPAGEPQVYLRTATQDHQARVSPDGRWVAYTSTESGRAEVYVDRFPTRGQRHAISRAGGAQPMWRRDGRELFYIASDGKMMAVPVTTGAAFEAGLPRELFQTQLRAPDLRDTRNGYVVTSDGQRFIVLTPAPQAVHGYTVVVGWAPPAR